MDMRTYQEKALQTAVYPEFALPIYPALGLANEAGEVLGKLKKAMRDDDCQLTLERAEAIRDELGDVLWYLAVLAHELGYGLDVIAVGNIAKLHSRKERGVLQGSGDTR